MKNPLLLLALLAVMVPVAVKAASDAEAIPDKKQTQAKYCVGLRKLALVVAKDLHSDASLDTMIANAREKGIELVDDIDDVTIRQLVYYVDGFRAAKTNPQDIAMLVHTQCLNGTYSTK
jgi:hypothetical protein